MVCAVVFCNELRSDSVHERFMTVFSQHFTIKRTPHRSKMDPVHQHPLIDIFFCQLRKQALRADVLTEPNVVSPGTL